MSLEVFLPLQFLKEFQKDRHQLFSKSLIEFSCETIQSWAFVFGRFLITASISVLVIGLFMISISSWFSLGKLNFSKNLFLPGYPFYCHIVVHKSLIIFCVSTSSVVTSPFSFLILLILFFSPFFLMSLAKDQSILFILSKNQLSVLLIFTIVSSFLFDLFLPGSS